MSVPDVLAGRKTQAVKQNDCNERVIDKDAEGLFERTLDVNWWRIPTCFHDSSKEDGNVSNLAFGESRIVLEVSVSLSLPL